MELVSQQKSQLPESLVPVFEKFQQSNSLAFHSKRNVTSFSNRAQKEEMNPMTHNPPRFDIYGNERVITKKPGEDPHNILVEEPRIPEWWSKPTDQKRTQTQLNQQRRHDNIPHISYDLDGDGIVGGRDLVLSKLFDQDKDGKLNTQERQNAERAIRDGLEGKFFWNVEKSGPNRPYRLIQKRGQFIDAEDYLPVTNTYPKHPISLKEASFKTQKEFKESIKQKNRQNQLRVREDLQIKKQAWDEANPAEVSQPFILSEYLVTNPKHRSMTEIKEEKRRAQRQKLGLLPVTQDIKNSEFDPSLAYRSQPNIISNSDLKEKRKTNALKDLKIYESLKHVTSLDRLMDREECVSPCLNNQYVRLGVTKRVGKTYKDVKEKFRKEMNENNVEKFGKQTIGVHGQELPKFSDSPDKVEYWRKSDGFVENPKYRSFLRMKQTNKYWQEKTHSRAKDDKLLLNDVEGDPVGPDAFKEAYFPQVKKNQVAPKPNAIRHFANTEDDLKKLDEGRYFKATKSNKRWTEQMQGYRLPKKNTERLSSLHAHDSKTDLAPLYSSFSPDGQFHPPPASRDLRVLTQGRQEERRSKTAQQVPQTQQTLLTRVSQRKPWGVQPTASGTVQEMASSIRATISFGVKSGGFRQF